MALRRVGVGRGMAGGLMGGLGSGVSGGAAFSPSDLAGLGVWLRSDLGLFQESTFATAVTTDTNPVGGWQDQSGNARHVLQATAGQRPTWKTNIINGLPVVRFDGVDDYLAGMSYALGSAATLFLVASKTAGTQDYLLSGTGSGSSSAIVSGYATVAYEWFNQVGASTDRYTFAGTSSGLNILAIRQTNGVSLTGYFNSATTVFSVVPVASLGNFNRLGTSTGANYAGADVAELIVYGRSLSDANLGSVMTYLKNRYAL